MNIFVKTWKFITGKDIEEMYNAAILENQRFIESLDDRQKSYYLNLHDTWRKELTKLEKRVHDLEEKS